MVYVHVWSVKENRWHSFYPTHNKHVERYFMLLRTVRITELLWTISIYRTNENRKLH